MLGPTMLRAFAGGFTLSENGLLYHMVVALQLDFVTDIDFTNNQLN